MYPGRRFFMPQNRIRELRQKKNLSQLQLSIELEVTQETISAYEHSKHLPSVTALMKMSQLFGVSMDYIMGISDVPQIAISFGSSLADEEQKNLLLLYYRKLGDKNRAKLLSYALGLLDSESR
mgnify:FL=1